MVGEQSAGKSSLLENISGIQFPRAQNTCTRMPCVLSLHTDRTVKESHAMVSIDPAFANDPCTVHRKTRSYFVSIHRERLQFLGQRLEQAMRDMLLSSFCMQPRQRHAPCRKLKSRSNSSPKNMQLAATSSSQARFLCRTAGRLLAVACNIHR